MKLKSLNEGSPAVIGGREGRDEDEQLALLDVTPVADALRKLWGVDSVKSTVSVLEEGHFSEEGGGFNWRGAFLLEDTSFCGGVCFDLEEGV